MTNYLDGLLSRSFAPAAEVLPRLRSRFEPTADSHTISTAGPGAEVETTPATARAPQLMPAAHESLHAPASLVPPAQSPVPPDRPPGPRREDASVSIPEIRAVTELPAVDPSTPPLSTIPPAAPAPPSTAPIVIRLRESQPERPPSPPVTVTAPVESARPPSDRRHPVQSAAEPKETVATNPIEPALHREAATPQTVAATPVSVSIRPATVSPAVSPASASTRRPDRATDHLETSAPEPTIHVTIGRVEIRASIPATPPATPARRETSLSLDAYLHQRSEGGRR